MRSLIAMLFVFCCLCGFNRTSEGQIVNEILADPPNDLEGDSNCDGTRDWSEDEFIEIVNNTNQTLDISGYILRDSVAIRHEFPQGTTLRSFQAIVVFGGGSPASQGCDFGGAILQVANRGSAGVGLNNDGDTVTLLDDGGATLDTYAYGSEGGANQSLVRFPDICGSFQQHSTVAEDGAAFSPGTTVNGAVFDNVDSDSDGVDDCNDGCPSDPLKTEPGVCGCGVEDVDTDSDGIYDCNDGCPTLPYDCSADGMIIYVTSTDQSIQWAIDAAPSGGTIEIVGGTFMLTNQIDPEGKAITIRGAADPETNEPLTILDGGGITRVISCTSGETDATEFENLCIQNGQELQGGGLRFHSSSPTLVNCTIQHNAATQFGGGVMINGGGSPSFTGCIIRENSVPNSGGGLYISESTLSMSGCLLEGNSANWAGGMDIHDSTVDLVDCTASGNQSDGGAGAISCRGGRMTINTSTFDGNVTSGSGGAMFFQTSIVELSNCDFLNNETGDDGSGAISIWYGNFSLTIKLCRVWCNGQDPIEGDYTDGGANCITDDCTECPDRCDVDSDLDGVVDCMDECPANPAYTIAGACGCGMSEADSDGDGTPDCLDYDHLVLSYGNIQNAVNGAEDGEVIQLQPGMYLPASPINTNGKQVTIRGALSDEGEILSILDGQTEHALLRCVNSESAGTVIENMVFQNGYSDTFAAGSAMDIIGAGPTLRNCVFKNNEGVALYMDEASASLHGCVFEGNDYGLLAQQTTASLYECIVRNNHDKGILIFNGNHMELTDCSFFNNTGTDGAGIRVLGSVVILLRCEFSGNVAEKGSAFYGSGSPEITMTHCSFMENSSSDVGGALYVSSVDNLHLSNCIIGGNSAGATGGGLSCQFIDNATFDACTFDGNIANSWGGGMSCSSITNLSLSHCEFRNNTTTLFRGGALNASSSDAIISSCTFENNTSAGYGGGMNNSSSSLTLTDTTVCNNVPDQISGDYTDNGGNCISQSCDSDNDGTYDCSDLCPDDANKTEPGICGCGIADDDSDGDGTADCNDGCPSDPLKTEPGVCGCGTPETDSDGDGTADCEDGCPADPLKTEAGECGCGVADDDSDNDGTVDCNDGCPSDPLKTEAGICGCGIADDDSDSDGTVDCEDGCPNDPLKIEEGICGCGVADDDSDNDGTVDCDDGCPNDPLKIEAGACGCGVADDDSDNDGTVDCEDGCPNDPLKTEAGICGCGVADDDSDNDGTVDCEDGCPNDPLKIEAGACGCGVADDDSDNDGTVDCDDGCPNDPLKIEEGACGCGVADDDSDNDGTPDCNDLCHGHPDEEDSDNDGTPDGCDPDTEWNVTPDDDLQTVIDGAIAGQSIILGAGEYLVSGTPIQILIAPLSLKADGVVTLRSTDAAHSIIIVASDPAAGSVTFEGLSLVGPLDSVPFNGSGSTPVTSGGGLNIVSGMVFMHQCAISDCTAEYGGAAAVSVGASLELSACVLFDNLATVSGGGVSVETSGVLAMTSTVVCSNAPDQVSGAYEADDASCSSDECEDANSDGTPDGCETAPPCPADLNGDGQISGGDLGLLLAMWGTADGDLNGNGNTDGGDLGLLLAGWGPCP